jgi:stage II sporulation protein E
VRADVASSIATALDGHGLRPRHILVTGDRVLRIRICGISPAALTLSRDELREALSTVCGVSLSRPHYDGTDDGTLTLYAEPRYRVECHHVSRAAVAGEAERTRPVCGDTLRTLVTDHGLFYALLCDGMGSGRQAGATSSAAAMLLERLLGAGVSIGTALRLVNHFLRTRADRPEHECSSTVDLLEVDLYTGQARLVKCGAAPSLLLHGACIGRIAAPTVPLGILGTVDAQSTPLELVEGDRILLLSDGVTDTVPSEGETGDWLCDGLAGEEDAALAETLLSRCRANGSLDDATVAVLRVRAVESRA